LSFEFLDFLLERAAPPLCGINVDRKWARFILFGYPFDGTVWQRPGTRFGPRAIREASLGLEEYSVRTGLFMDELMIHDAGDLQVLTGDIYQTARRVEKVVREIIENEKTPIIIGGEHTVTLPAVSTILPDILIVFDAHLDLRSEWPLGVKYSHATVMRRIAERIGAENIVFIGTRAISREEYEYVKGRNILIINALKVRRNLQEAVRMLESRLRDADTIYVSVDVDVLEPGIAPGVSDPEPEGLIPYELFELLYNVIDERLVGADIVEVSPLNDNGVTTYYAAKITLEMAAYKVYKSK